MEQPIRHRSIATNGIHLHVACSGPDNGPLVILLHGFPEFWYGWRHQMPALAEAGFLVVAPDQRGYNTSEKPPGITSYRVELLANDVTGIIDSFNRDRAVLIGHDWGGVVAWRIASFHPGRVERLVVLNAPHPAAMNRAMRQPLLRQLLKSWYIFFFQLSRVPEWSIRQQNYRALRRGLVRTSRNGTFSQEDLQKTIQAVSQPGALTASINWYRAIVREGLKTGPRPYEAPVNRRVQVPTLLLWGDRDAFLEPVLADWSMEWVDRGALVHFPTATHWIQHEEITQVNQHIHTFLSELYPS